MAVTALLAFLSPSYWLYYAAIVGSVVAVSKARNTKRSTDFNENNLCNDHGKWAFTTLEPSKKEFVFDPTRVYDQMPKPVLISLLIRLNFPPFHSLLSCWSGTTPYNHECGAQTSPTWPRSSPVPTASTSPHRWPRTPPSGRSSSAATLGSLAGSSGTQFRGRLPPNFICFGHF